MLRRAVAELFAGVGGFRVGLERTKRWDVEWSNQWEPSTKTVQHASEVYIKHFGKDGHTNEDIKVVLDQHEEGTLPIPDVDLVCGGFPCQDYSVAKPLSQATGIAGQKGVLWWEIHRFLELKRPRFLLLENVDRLLKSPTDQRGRDFAVMLTCLARLGYLVEWRVINAADYGFAQRRRRVFIVGRLLDGDTVPDDPQGHIHVSGVLARALPVRRPERAQLDHSGFRLPEDPFEVSERFGSGGRGYPFARAGVMCDFDVWTADPDPKYRGKERSLGSVLQPPSGVPEEFYIPAEQVPAWRRLKGAKNAPREKNGFAYKYSEGAVAFPEPLHKPSRTILTGEGGSTPSRFKHVVEDEDGRLRRLTPIELEKLNGFRRDWTRFTESGEELRPARRAFLMGNALVVGVVERIGRSLAAVADELEGRSKQGGS